jgi:hypothetical protein
MSDNARVFAGALAGALFGGAAAYLLLTSRGRQTLADLQPALADLSHAAHDLRLTLETFGQTAEDTGRGLHDVRTTRR